MLITKFETSKGGDMKKVFKIGAVLFVTGLAGVLVLGVRQQREMDREAHQ